jgi:prepilin-type N-terminal cleavage/methylation domain-containing protein
MGGRVETLNVQTLKRSNVSKGFSLIEAIAALTIFGMAIVVAAGFLDVQMSAARRLEARSDLVRAAETVLESVRGGTLPLVTGEVDLTDEFLPLSTIRVRTRVGVTSRSPQGLYTVRVEARAMVRTEDMVVTITTQVWRP